ncbi:ATP-binding protein [Rhodobacter sp. KR11]|uniref:ATP-binding protein n=1 Tax=Rhodobacter sp. KR11 TaxID=2974588 RepID=UPI002222AE26|nr:ATP-binding protein [Rhodobacter sp. KR11]MCW1920865.1 ATP-binding protein [Rhodobacter sp. KR11]
MTAAETSTNTEHGSSPASRGAAGAYIEGEIGALYLLALLTGNRAPGLPSARITSVRFQGVEQGFKLDDLIIRGVGASGDALLEIQSKRDIQFSPKDPVYRDVAQQIARSTIGDVPAERHLFGIATQRTSRKISGAYQEVLGWARSAATADEFFTRLTAKGVANPDMRKFVETTREHLVAGDVVDEDETIWRLLRRILILEFDFEASAPIARTYGLALARMALVDEQVARAEALWSRLVDLSIQTGTRGGEIDTAALKANLAEADFKLADEREYGSARLRLAELARNTLSHIGTSVASVTLPRLAAVAALDGAVEKQRFIVVRGDAGVGKSWVLRHYAERVAARAPIIVLDSEATPPGGWLYLANALGIPGSAAAFLTDLAASGGAYVFIDGIDMVDDAGRQRTISELLRAACAIPGFTVVATARRTGASAAIPWLDDRISTAVGGIHLVEVGALSDEEVAILVDQAPELRILLNASHPAAQLARNLYRLSRLLREPSAASVRTEAGLAQLWWISADAAPTAEVRAAQRILKALATAALKGEAGIDLDEDSPARDHLLGAQSLREVRPDRLDFNHDVLRDWAIGNYIAEDPSRLSGFDLDGSVPPRVARGIEIAARIVLETGKDASAWLDLLTHLSPPNAHGSWRRHAILALVRSEIAIDLLEKSSASLLAEGGSLLTELSTTIVAVETQATTDIMTLPDGSRADLPRSYRTDVTGSSTVVLRWVHDHAAEVPMSAISAVVELVEIQIFILKMIPSLAKRTSRLLFDWLYQLDLRDTPVTIPGMEGRSRWASDARRQTIDKLRLMGMLLGSYVPDALKAYLTAITGDGDHHKMKDLRQFSSVIAPVAPAELAAMVQASLVEKKQGGHWRERLMERAFSFADSDYLPPSPAQPPFLDLLNAAPTEGLALIRWLVDEAIAFHTDGREPGEDGITVDFGEGPRFFPWGWTYGWSRGNGDEYAAASGLLALEAWSQKRLDDGESVEAVLADILGPEGSAAAYLLIAIDVLLSHGNVARVALVPFLASPQLLAKDRNRQIDDKLGSGLDRLGPKNEPKGPVRMADLKARPSRSYSLMDALPNFLADEPVGNALRTKLAAVVVTLDPYTEHATLSDAEFAGRYALNVLTRANWFKREDGNLEYRSPLDEAAHCASLGAMRDVSARAMDMEARISLAVNGGEYATADTARDAVAYAEGGVPGGSDTDVLQSRATRLITTALLVARDGDDALLAAHEAWVREVIGITLEENPNRDGSARDTLRYNSPAIAILALIHLWARLRKTADRDALVALATRQDRAAVPALAAAVQRILEIEPRLFKAMMRAAYASMTWRRKGREPEDEALQAAFQGERAAWTDAAVKAELAWLDDDAEPNWPAWPDERPNLRRAGRVRVPGSVTLAKLDADDAPKTVVDASPGILHVSHRAAAQWLAIIQSAPEGSIGWQQEIVSAYAEWTGRMNGLGYAADAEISREPTDWNSHFYAFYAERLLEGDDEAFVADLPFVTDLPDGPFGEVAQTVQHVADVLYFNHASRAPARPVSLREKLVTRLMALSRWQSVRDPGEPRIDLDSGGVIAKLLFNTYGPITGTHSYLPPAVFDRVDPFLPVLRPMLPGGPTVFVARCTMNLLLVAPRSRHVGFLLDAVEAWFSRTTSSELWIAAGVGRLVVQWFEACVVEDPGLLAPAYPARARIDRALGRLIAVGVAEAYDLEQSVMAAAELPAVARIRSTPN